MKILSLMILLVAFGLTSACTLISDETDSESMMDRQTIITSEFDFLEGRWQIQHRRLKEWLAESNEWSEFETDYQYWSLLGGLANMDRLWGEFGGQYYEGASVRTFDTQTGEWTIYWMDTRHPNLAEQVRGRFDGDRGEFFGDDVFEGRACDCALSGKRYRTIAPAGNKPISIPTPGNGRRTGSWSSVGSKRRDTPPLVFPARPLLS